MHDPLRAIGLVVSCGLAWMLTTPNAVKRVDGALAAWQLLLVTRRDAISFQQYAAWL